MWWFIHYVAFWRIHVLVELAMLCEEESVDWNIAKYVTLFGKQLYMVNG